MEIEKVKKGVLSGENLHPKNDNTIILDDGHLPPFRGGLQMSKKGVTFVENRLNSWMMEGKTRKNN